MAASNSSLSSSSKRKKNEKEEDKWTCPKCSYDNIHLQNNCDICGEKKPSSMINKIYSFLNGNKQEEPTYWSCPDCTCDNNVSVRTCEACNYKLPETADDIRAFLKTQLTEGLKKISSKLLGGTSTDNTTQWMSPYCKHINLIDYLECQRCQGRKLSPDKEIKGEDRNRWTCPHCTFNNHQDMLVCEKCNQPNPIRPPSYPPYQLPLNPLLEPHPKPQKDSPDESLKVIKTSTGEELVGDATVINALLDQGKHIIDLTTPEYQEKIIIICPHCNNDKNDINDNSCRACRRPIYPDHDSTGQRIASFERQQSRSLTVSEIRQTQEDYALATWYNIVDQHKQMKESFIDPDFPHTDRSLYSNPSKPLTRWHINKWLRPNNIVTDEGSRKWCVYEQPKPNDIAQGSLGNCWFLSALAVIAEVPKLLQEIIITKELCPQGVYLVRLCQDGFWKSILIDDYFPVRRDHRLAFSKARRGQLWVPLIEKALAKMYGSYESLDGGQIISGLSVLTGYPCEQVVLRHGTDTGDSVDHELVWAKLLSFNESKFPMAASSSPTDPVESMGRHDDAGIQPFHAYSILDVKQIGTESLVLLRDPWGHTNWWKPGHEWMESEPGTFWIGANDLFRYFSHVDVCHYHPDWHSVRVNGHLLSYAPANLKVLTFQTFAPTEVKLCLYQPSHRGRYQESHKKVDMTLLIMRYEGSGSVLDAEESLPYPSECVVASNCRVSSVVTCFTLLNPGRYAVVPLNFSNWHNYDIVSYDTSHESHVPYVLALFSAKVIEWLEQVPTKPGFVSDSLFLLAKKKGTLLKQFSSKVKIYQVHLRHSCYYFVVENQSSYHVRIECDASQSINAKSSRNKLYMDDIIPPNHKQVLVVFSPLITDSMSMMIQTRFIFTTVFTNPLGQWGSHMSPSLTETNRELHSPRPLF